MKCEFVRDDNNVIWLQFASDIYSRTNWLAKRALVEKQKRIEDLVRVRKEKELEAAKGRAAKPAKVAALKNIMSNHFEVLKEKSGLNSDRIKIQDNQSNEVFKILRPNSNMDLHQFIKHEKDRGVRTK